MKYLFFNLNNIVSFNLDNSIEAKHIHCGLYTYIVENQVTGKKFKSKPTSSAIAR